jgi:hypothetical protein
MTARLSTKKASIYFLCFAALLLQLSTSVHSQSQVYTDGQLIQIGQDVYQKRDFVGAVMFLFAYIQKNPQALSTNSQFNKEVQTAYQFSLDQVRNAWVAGQVAQNRPGPGGSPGVGMVTQGLGVRPPPLTIPPNAR